MNGIIMYFTVHAGILLAKNYVTYYTPVQCNCDYVRII